MKIIAIQAVLLAVFLLGNSVSINISFKNQAQANELQPCSEIDCVEMPHKPELRGQY